MKSPRLYRRLGSARKVGFATGGWISLHAAPDHLLLRASSGFVETYRRFYFVDIEAISIRKTVRGLFWNVALGLGLSISLIVLIATPAPHAVSGFFAGIFVFLLSLNISLGPTCATQLQTRVQTRWLPLRRVRKALRVVDQLFKKIEAAQAQIALAAPVETQVPPLAPVVQAQESSLPPPLPGEKRLANRIWLHDIVFGLLMLNGAIAIWAGLQHTAPLRYSACVALLANLLVGIVALVLQRHYRLPPRPGLVVWISVIAHSIAFPTIYTVYSFIYAFEMAKATGPAAGPPTMQMPLSALGNLPGFDMVLLVSGVVCVALGLIGYFAILAALWRTRPERTG